MSMPTDGYKWVEVETYHAVKAGKASSIHVRPIAGQGLDVEMDVECSRDMRKKHPVGTRFRVLAKVTDREGGKPFLYSHHSWRYEVLGL